LTFLDDTDREGELAMGEEDKKWGKIEKINLSR
jgi:hypothetical protein